MKDLLETYLAAYPVKHTTCHTERGPAMFAFEKLKPLFVKYSQNGADRAFSWTICKAGYCLRQVGDILAKEGLITHHLSENLTPKGEKLLQDGV